MPRPAKLPIVIRRPLGHYSAINPRFKLSPEDKLDALRRLDPFRHWGSLDDERQCLSCGKTITGRQIQILGGTRGQGPLRPHCPTEGCASIPIDWILPATSIRPGDVAPAPTIPAIPSRKKQFVLSRHLRELGSKLKRRRTPIPS